MRNKIAVTAVLVSVLFMAFFAGPFFLLPYYSISGNFRIFSQQNIWHNTTVGSLVNLIEVCHGTLPNNPEILFLSITRLNELRLRNLTLHSVLWTESDDLTCPEGFIYEPLWVYFLDSTSSTFRRQNSLMCMQWRFANVSFFDFITAEWEHDIDYNGPIIQSQHVIHTMWDLTDLNALEGHSVYMQSFLFDFGLVKSNHDDSDPFKKGCDIYNSTSCDDFYRNLVNDSSNDIRYQRNSAFCINNEDCAAIVKLGEEECHDNYFYNSNYKRTNDSNCYFTIHYMVFDKLPKLYTFGNMWTYNVVVFVTCLAVWLFSSLYVGRIWHRQYLRRYYIVPHPYYDLPKGKVYDLRLQFSGEPFSKFTGEFQLKCIDDSDSILYRIPLIVQFEDEDVIGTKIACILQKYAFKLDQDAKCECILNWDGEFELADFTPPHVEVTLKRKLPRTVGAISSIFFMPLIALQQIITNYPRHYMFIWIEEYRYLSFYLALVHITWMLSVSFLVFMNLRSAEDTLYGYVDYKPAWSIIYYVIFLIVTMAASLIIIVIKPLWYKKKNMNRRTMQFASGDLFVQKSELLALETDNRSSLHHHISHIDVEYLPLKEKRDDEVDSSDTDTPRDSEHMELQSNREA